MRCGRIPPNRHVTADPDLVVELYDRRNALLKELEGLRAARNANADKMKAKLPPDERARLIEEGKRLKESIAELEKRHEETEKKLTEEALKIPNMSHPDAPVGEGEAGNKQLRTWGAVPSFSFAPKDHVEIGQGLDLIDFETGAKVAGQKFYYLKNEAVILELALVRYALDAPHAGGLHPVHHARTWRERRSWQAMGSTLAVPRATSTAWKAPTCASSPPRRSPSAGTTRGRSFPSRRFPSRLRECRTASAARRARPGQFSKGLYRVHQFTKVEMFVFCHPSGSEAMLERLIGIEERIFQGLEIPYRIVDTCTGDLGGPAYRKFDIEAWMPGQGGKGRVGGDHERIQLHGLPGAAAGHPLPGRGKERVRAHAERHGAGRFTHAHCAPGELPERGRERRASGRRSPPTLDSGRSGPGPPRG